MSEEEDSPLTENIVFLVLLVGAIIFTFSLIWTQMNGADIWGEYYSKEITRIINFAQPGDKIEIDFHKATVAARKNGLIDQKEIFSVDNPNNKICIKLSPGVKKCYSYFNDVDVVNYQIKSGAFAETEKNTLVFEIKENQRRAAKEQIG